MRCLKCKECICRAHNYADKFVHIYEQDKIVRGHDFISHNRNIFSRDIFIVFYDYIWCNQSSKYTPDK